MANDKELILRWLYSFLLFLSFLIAACNTPSIDTPVEGVTPADPAITTTPISVKTDSLIPTNTLTSTSVMTIPLTQTPKPRDNPVTELRLRLKNAKGESVPFAKAELLLSAWSVASSFSLKTDDDL